MIENTILVGVRLDHDPIEVYENTFEELRFLAHTAGLHVVGDVRQSRNTPDSKYFIGSGKLDELHVASQQQGVSLIIFNESLTPSQQKNIEDLCGVRVMDRVGLILHIFSQRAKTQEAKLQVALAQYEYLLPRLTRLWVHFSQQAGYVGTRGPGETQLEIDRRRISTKIRFLKQKTKDIRQHHALLRDGRKKKGARMVSLVGYTNAGKSTLFNVLTQSDVFTENQLFATLDPTVRKFYIEGINNVVLSDTVGFIQRLPHQLIDAFKATLDEVIEADMLLHVVDGSASYVDNQVQAVFDVLKGIGAAKKPMILVCNKSDKILIEKKTEIEFLAQGHHLPCVFVSALYQTGLDTLSEKIYEVLSQLEKNRQSLRGYDS